MKRYLSLIALAAAAIGVTAGMALANERLEYPDDFNGPPIYATVAYEPDQEWTPIVFYRHPDCIPDNANLLELNFAAWACPFLMDGFVIFSDAGPIHETIHGAGTPIWFVTTADLETINGDGVVTVPELEGLPSLVKGTTTRFLETAHFIGSAQVPFAEVQTEGTLDDGGTFSIHLSEAWLPPAGEHVIFNYEINVEIEE
jgi:hypothetical protein